MSGTLTLKIGDMVFGQRENNNGKNLPVGRDIVYCTFRNGNSGWFYASQAKWDLSDTGADVVHFRRLINQCPELRGK